MKFETNYPFVLVHGMYGFGQGELINKFLPYWGMGCGDLVPYLKSEGFEVYNPAVSPINSAWDRTCELYAQLVGGTVDYGKAHSEKYGHKRFGRTYPIPLFEGWSSEKKVNLLGHSFGGPTIRMLSALLANGSKDEIDATDENDISPLFTGGKGDWVHSVTGIAAVHEGTTLTVTMPKVLDALKKFTTFAANATGGTFSRIIDFQAEQWDLNYIANYKNVKAIKNKERQQAVVNSDDTIYYDISIEGAREVNKIATCNDSTYYFSWPCRKSSQKYATGKRAETPRVSMCPFFIPMSKTIGKCSWKKVGDVVIDEKWLPNDGLMPTISERAPMNEPQMDLVDAKGEYNKGVWYVYDTFPMDHLGIIGGFFPPENADNLRKIYLDHFRLINSLK